MHTYLLTLLEHIGNFRGALKEETMTCMRIATFLKEASLTHKCSYVWFHVPNEGKCSRVFGALMRAIGRISGAPDYIFASQKGCLFLEVKARSGKLSPSQKLFKQWCVACGVPYEIAYNYDEAIEVLKNHRIV